MSCMRYGISSSVNWDIVVVRAQSSAKLRTQTAWITIGMGYFPIVTYCTVR